MSIPLPLQNVVNLFGQYLTAYDVTAALMSGRTIYTTAADRQIFGVIQPNKDKEVSLLGDGALSSGSLILHTRDAVSAFDLSQEFGQINSQTYIRYSAEIWKLNYTQNWADKTGGSTRYILTKYTDIDDTTS